MSKIPVDLKDVQYSSFAILVTCRRAMQAHGVPEYKIREFKRQAAKCGDFRHFLELVLDRFEVTGLDATHPMRR